LEARRKIIGGLSIQSLDLRKKGRAMLLNIKSRRCEILPRAWATRAVPIIEQ
jgi:hypothetical protein